MSKYLIYLTFGLWYAGLSNAACVSRTSDKEWSSPAISGTKKDLSGGIQRGDSELITVRTMQTLDEEIPNGSWERVNCPHLQSGLLNWEDSSTWSSTVGHVPTSSDTTITLPSNSKVLIRNCTFNSITNDVDHPYQRIVVPDGSALIFDDSDIELHVREIKISSGGNLSIGAETCRLFSNITIVLHGMKNDSSLAMSDSTKTSKGIISNGGTVDIHGKQYHPTWTRLTYTVLPGDTLVYLQDSVNWEVGQQIVVITSAWFDCPPEYEVEWCSPCYLQWQTCNPAKQQNEIRTIVAIDNSSSGNAQIIQVDEPFHFQHWASYEYQTEVVLLSRRIVIQGTDSDEYFGGHILLGGGGLARISGVLGYQMGQQNILGRYPFHFHMNGQDQNTMASYFKDCAVWKSFFRCYVIHGTNYTTLQRNVAFDAWGMCFYLEDGVEENNVLEYNFAGHVHPIFQPASGGSQSGDVFNASSSLLIPADTSASGFYVSNSFNYFIGNAASGGWSGFAFPNLPKPIQEYKGTNWGNNNPMNRPFPEYGAFDGNTAHSSGYQWQSDGGCMYVGAYLEHLSNGLLQYHSGRFERDTQWPNGTDEWMYFTNTKTWLCNRGINHWGKRMVIHYYESHDNLRSAVMFGESGFDTGLVVGRTGNLNGTWQQEYRWQPRQGFQFYDTWVKTMLSNIIWRNFGQVSDDQVILYMTHSDHYIPQGINSVEKMQFENVNITSRLHIDNCGSLCGARETMSSRIAAVYDYDGTLSNSNRKSIIGSHRDWWNLTSGGCNYLMWNVWRCDWTSSRVIAFVELYIPGLMDGCDDNNPLSPSNFSCNDQNAGYTVGYVSQWKQLRSIPLSPWPGVAGHSNIGWYWRPVWGPPSYFTVGPSVQIAPRHFIVLAIRYPSTAQFTVTPKSTWWGVTYPTIAMAASKDVVMNPVEDLLEPENMNCSTTHWYDFCYKTGGVGPAWYFDGEYLYIRVVNLACYNRNARYYACFDASYDFKSMKLWDISTAFSLEVSVTSCSGCSVATTYQDISYYDVDDVLIDSSVPSISESLSPSPSPSRSPTVYVSPSPTAYVSPSPTAYVSPSPTAPTAYVSPSPTSHSGTGGEGSMSSASIHVVSIFTSILLSIFYSLL